MPDMSNAKIFSGTQDEVERQLFEEYMREGYAEFTERYHQNDKAYFVVSDVFNLSQTKEWPEQFFVARDAVWPLWFGEKGVEFLKYYITGGKQIPRLQIQKEDVIVLENWRLLFGNVIRKAENYSWGNAKLDYIDSLFNNQENKKSYLMRFFRKDGERLNIEITPVEAQKMLERLINMLPEIERIFGAKIDKTKMRDMIEKQLDSEK